MSKITATTANTNKSVIYSDFLNIPVYKIMWSANTGMFKDFGEDYKYDLFFSGVVRPEQTNNWRTKIYNNLDKLSQFKVKVNARLQSTGYSGKHFSVDEYAHLLACSKICLTTTGPADLVGTRYFEIMAGNRSLILCNYMNKNVYGDMLIDGFNCVMFSSLEEYFEKVNYYLTHENERLKIVKNAHEYFIQNLTWNKQIVNVTNILNSLV